MLPSFKLLSRHKHAAKILVCVLPSSQKLIPSLNVWEIIPSAKYTLKQWSPLFHLLKAMSVLFQCPQIQTRAWLHCLIWGIIMYFGEVNRQGRISSALQELLIQNKFLVNCLLYFWVLKNHSLLGLIFLWLWS